MERPPGTKGVASYQAVRECDGNLCGSLLSFIIRKVRGGMIMGHTRTRGNGIFADVIEKIQIEEFDLTPHVF